MNNPVSRLCLLSEGDIIIHLREDGQGVFNSGSGPKEIHLHIPALESENRNIHIHFPNADQVQAWLPDGYSRIFRSYVFGPSGFWTMALLRYAAKFDPFLSLDCARVEGVGAQSKERKGSYFAA